jgi:DNA-binding PadR family transcriptional regulator
MALAHAILVSLLDEPLTGYALAKRFEASIGFFWGATHQQIYKELAKLNDAGQVTAEVVEQKIRPNRVVYSLAQNGIDALLAWAVQPSKPSTIKEDLLVKCHALEVVGRDALLADLRGHENYHRERLALFLRVKARFFQDPQRLQDKALGRYLSLSAGIQYEQFQLQWIAEASALLITD